MAVVSGRNSLSAERDAAVSTADTGRRQQVAAPGDVPDDAVIRVTERLADVNDALRQ